MYAFAESGFDSSAVSQSATAAPKCPSAKSASARFAYVSADGIALSALV